MRAIKPVEERVKRWIKDFTRGGFHECRYSDRCDACEDAEQLERAMLRYIAEARRG